MSSSVIIYKLQTTPAIEELLLSMWGQRELFEFQWVTVGTESWIRLSGRTLEYFRWHCNTNPAVLHSILACRRPKEEKQHA